MREPDPDETADETVRGVRNIIGFSESAGRCTKSSYTKKEYENIVRDDDLPCDGLPLYCQVLP